MKGDLQGVISGEFVLLFFATCMYVFVIVCVWEGAVACVCVGGWVRVWVCSGMEFFVLFWWEASYLYSVSSQSSHVHLRRVVGAPLWWTKSTEADHSCKSGRKILRRDVCFFSSVFLF